MNESKTIYCNDHAYSSNSQPGVVICLDGTGPDYIKKALDDGLMPNWKLGHHATVLSAHPSMTNPNNVSIITGVPPKVHGITANTSWIKGKETLLKGGDLIKCPTILETFNQQGNHVLVITTKSKLFDLLSRGLNKETSLVLSIEQLKKMMKKNHMPVV